jgi:hypothetical protein
MILSEVREERPHSLDNPQFAAGLPANAEATVLQQHWVRRATTLRCAINVICLADRALTGDFGTGIASLSLLSRFGRNVCSCSADLVSSVPIFRRSMTYTH